MTYGGHRDQRWGPTTYAQHGDDLMIVNVFEILGIEKPSYLDIGAHHPTIINNTRLLYERGSRGVNVDANPFVEQAFKTERPEDVFVHAGVGAEIGKRTFYMYSNTSGRNTFSPSEVNRLKDVLTVQHSILVDMVSLDHIVEKHCHGKWPDLLTMDIEDFDYNAVNRSELRVESGPKLIVIETRKDQGPTMNTLMRSRGYWPLVRMGENMFYVSKDNYGRLTI